MARRSLVRYYRNDRLPDIGRTEGPDAVIKGLWADRATRWIDRQRDGIDSWQSNGQPVRIEELVNAYVRITNILDEAGADVGLCAEFFMKPRDASSHQHMATFYYGPPRSTLGVRRKRQLMRTQYHV